MNKNVKTFLIILGSVIIAGGSLAYGALTADHAEPAATTAPVRQLTKAQLSEQLKSELPTILGVLNSKYPKIATDYVVNSGQLFDRGEWFGTTLSYRGTDTANRDTLRVLLQKVNGIWKIRTTPPEMILSAKDYPDVPKSILKAINQPISLP